MSGQVMRFHVDDLAEPWASRGKLYNPVDGLVWVVFLNGRIQAVLPTKELAESCLADLNYHLTQNKPLPTQTLERVQSIANALKRELKQREAKAIRKSDPGSSLDPAG
jgi:hypothetical protein